MNNISKLNELLVEYSKSHQHPINKGIHGICVPLIYWNLLGLILCGSQWIFQSSLLLKILLLVTVTGYYLQLSYRLSFYMLAFTSLCFYTHEQLLLYISLFSYCISMVIVFFILWALQLLGHHIEGKKPAFLKDLAFLMIGPAWVMLAFLPTQRR
jgi:uncharacterized membrane protein YGL010W